MPESWSILEVINHLLDEEREDFRVRINICLFQPAEAWPPIDPPGWAIESRYNERELVQSLENYLEERKASLDWLKNLNVPDWNARYEAPFGPISAGDLFASWVTHDLLHMRQLVELHQAYLEQLAAPFSLDYAGAW